MLVVKPLVVVEVGAELVDAYQEASLAVAPAYRLAPSMADVRHEVGVDASDVAGHCVAHCVEVDAFQEAASALVH